LSTYAIGDIQGCYNELSKLLQLINFDKRMDTLWLAGDLINRGPSSLAVMKQVMGLGNAAKVVLGNHELHLLALVTAGLPIKNSKDTFHDILASPDCSKIVQWLKQQSFCHWDAKLNFAMVHAGVPPEWSLAKTLDLARELESALANEDSGNEFLLSMYGNEPATWNDKLTGNERLRFIANCLTRCRYFTKQGAMNFSEKRTPMAARAELIPWYLMPARKTASTRIIFGHWASLNLPKTEWEKHLVYPLDTGAVWGRKLTAMRLEDKEIFSVQSEQIAES
jgi:bis(5'-nucleosyl)-tetraphosphatase (symmetrical)